MEAGDLSTWWRGLSTAATVLGNLMSLRLTVTGSAPHLPLPEVVSVTSWTQ